jgi:Raf kinase inhibitor-like YbhB/YbcL family protein
MTFLLSSLAFAEDGDIPARFTCDDAGISPPLSWQDAPDNAQSFVLLFHDPDSTKKPDFTHWVLFDVPATVSKLAEGDGDTLGTPGGNDFGSTGYGGPCPAVGRHRYIFDLYALDIPALGLPPSAGRAEVEAAMEGHLLARARLAAYYQRPTQAG